MPKSNFFFVDSTIDPVSFSPNNPLFSRSTRLRKNLFYLDKSKILRLKIEKKYYSSVFKSINFDLLTVFYVVVILGSVSRAAKQLSLTQPSVSLSLRKIEKETGLLLFKHLVTKKRTILTSYGSILFNHIERLFNIIDEGLEFSNLNFSSSYSNTWFYLKNKNLNLSHFSNPNNNLSFYRKKGTVFAYILKNFFIDFYNLNLSHYENESKFVFKRGTSINFKKFHTLAFADFYTTPLILDKSASLRNINHKKLSLFNERNLIEIQTKAAFNLCLEMKVSNFVYWGSEI